MGVVKGCRVGGLRLIKRGRSLFHSTATAAHALLHRCFVTHWALQACPSMLVVFTLGRRVLNANAPDGISYNMISIRLFSCLVSVSEPEPCFKLCDLQSVRTMIPICFTQGQGGHQESAFISSSQTMDGAFVCVDLHGIQQGMTASVVKSRESTLLWGETVSRRLGKRRALRRGCYSQETVEVALHRCAGRRGNGCWCW